MDEVRRTPSWLSRFLFGGSSQGSWVADLLLLAARLYAGVTIGSAGFDKLPTPEWMVGQVEQVGFPAAGLFAVLACLSEFAGGIVLAFGFLTRPVALVLAFTMGVASFGFHGLTPITGMHIAQGYVWLFAVFVAVGAGRFSLDALVRRVWSRPEGGKFAHWIGALVVVTSLGYGLYREFLLTSATQVVADDGNAITSVSLAGTFNEWDLTATPMSGDGDSWTATIELAEPGPVQFKFAANGSWDLNLGRSDDGVLRVPSEAKGSVGGANITMIVPGAGRYGVTLDVGTYMYSVTRVDDGG